MGRIEDSLTVLYFQKYKENFKKWLPHILECEVPRQALLKKYEISLHYKEFISINDIPENEKRKLVEMARSTGIRFTNKTLIEAAKIIYFLQKIDKK